MRILDWYDIDEKSNVLFVEKNINSIEEYVDKKYDYIFLNGTLENSYKLIDSKNPEMDLLIYFKKLLNENGKLVVAVDNKFGVKYLVGNKSEHCDNIFDSLKNEFRDGRLYSKKELDDIISEVGFKYKKYYYPLPNYENPNSVYTDNFLPKIDFGKFNYNYIYNENSLIVQDEIGLLKNLIKENKFRDFTNSYVIELSDVNLDNGNIFLSFTPMRKKQYSMILKMKNDYVEKFPETKEALNHVYQINKNIVYLKKLGFNVAEIASEDMVKSKFINMNTFDTILIDSFKKGNVENVFTLIDKWINYISSKLYIDENGIVNEGFIDMVFENTFFDEKNDSFIFFDQEWFEEKIPFNFIVYRAINNLYEYNVEINKIYSKENFLKRFGINEEDYIEKERKFQEKIVDCDKRAFYSSQYKYIISPKEIFQIKKDVQKLDKDNIELIKSIDYLKKIIEENECEITKKEKEIIEKEKIIKEQENYLKNSIVYKILKIINNKRKK